MLSSITRIERVGENRVVKWHYTEQETREEYARSCAISQVVPYTYTAAPFELLYYQGRLAMGMDYCGETLLEYRNRNGANPSKEWAMIALQTVQVFLSVGSSFEIRDCHMNNVCVANEPCLGYPCVRFIDLAMWFTPPVNSSPYRTITVSCSDIEARLWAHIPGAEPLTNLIVTARGRNRNSSGGPKAFVDEVLAGMYAACLQMCTPYFYDGDFRTSNFLACMLYSIRELLPTPKGPAL